MKLGEYIKEFRERMNWSQREFARKCGLSNTYISLLEKGGVNPKTGETITPDMATIRAIASTMEISIHELLTAVDDCYIDISSPVAPVLMREPQRTYFEEPEILKVFNSLSEEGKQYLLQQAKIAQQIYGGSDNG